MLFGFFLRTTQLNLRLTKRRIQFCEKLFWKDPALFSLDLISLGQTYCILYVKYWRAYKKEYQDIWVLCSSFILFSTFSAKSSKSSKSSAIKVFLKEVWSKLWIKMGIFQQLHERLFFLGSIFNRSDTGNRSQVLHDIDNQIMKQKTTMLGKCIKNMPNFFS